MRIAILNWKDLENPAAGGAEVFVHEVAADWVAAGHVVTLFTSGFPGAEERAADRGVAIVRCGGKYSVYKQLRKLVSAEVDGKYDVVVDTVNTRPFMTPTYLRQTPSVALVFQVCREVWHTEVPFPADVVGRYVLEPWWLRRYRTIPTLTISDSSASSLREHGFRDVTVVPLGMTPPGVTHQPKDDPATFVFVGRLAKNKRPDHAVRAFSALAQTMPKARLIVIGDGPMREQLEKDAPKGVIFAGRLTEDEKLETMSRATALVATSVREGWGLIVTEAASVGTPSVCYDVAGLRDSVAATGMGMLTAPTPRALAEGMLQIASAGDGDRRVSHFTKWSETADACLAVVQRVVDTGGRLSHTGRAR